MTNRPWRKEGGGPQKQRGQEPNDNNTNKKPRNNSEAEQPWRSHPPKPKRGDVVGNTPTDTATTVPGRNNKNNRTRNASGAIEEKLQQYKDKTQIVRLLDHSAPPPFINPNLSPQKVLLLNYNIDTALEKYGLNEVSLRLIRGWMSDLHPSPVTYGLVLEKWLNDRQSADKDGVGERDYSRNEMNDDDGIVDSSSTRAIPSSPSTTSKHGVSYRFHSSLNPTLSFPDGLLTDLLQSLSPEISHHLITQLADLYVVLPQSRKSLPLYSFLNPQTYMEVIQDDDRTDVATVKTHPASKKHSKKFHSQSHRTLPENHPSIHPILANIPSLTIPLHKNNPNYDTEYTHMVHKIHDMIYHGPMVGAGLEEVAEAHDLKRFIFSQLDRIHFFSPRELQTLGLSCFPQTALSFSSHTHDPVHESVRALPPVTEANRALVMQMVPPYQRSFGPNQTIQQNHHHQHRRHQQFSHPRVQSAQHRHQSHMLSLLKRHYFPSLHKWAITPNQPQIHIYNDKYLSQQHNVLKSLKDQLTELVVGQYGGSFEDGSLSYGEDLEHPITTLFKPQSSICFSKLEKLSLSSLPLQLLHGDNGAYITCPNLREFNFSLDRHTHDTPLNRQHDNAVLTVMIKWINTMPNLTRLNLSGNRFTSHHLELLSQSPILLQLTHLDLSRLGQGVVSDVSASGPPNKKVKFRLQEFFSSRLFQNATKLTELKLHCNDGAQISQIIPILAANQSLSNLQLLTLHDCPWLTSSPIQSLYDSPHFKNLITLSYGSTLITFDDEEGGANHLNHNNIQRDGNEGDRNLVKAQSQSSVSPFPALQTLSIGVLVGEPIPLRALAPPSLLLHLDSLSIVDEFNKAHSVEFFRDLFQDNKPTTQSQTLNKNNLSQPDRCLEDIVANTANDTVSLPDTTIKTTMGLTAISTNNNPTPSNRCPLLAPNLTKFSICLNTRDFNDSHLKAILPSSLSSQLTLLSISLGETMSDDGVLALFHCDFDANGHENRYIPPQRQFPNLTHLNLSDNFNLTPNTLSYLSKLPYLRQLHSLGLYGITGITPLDLDALEEHGHFRGVVYCNGHEPQIGGNRANGDDDSDDEEMLFAGFGAGDSSDGD